MRPRYLVVTYRNTIFTSTSRRYLTAPYQFQIRRRDTHRKTSDGQDNVITGK